MKASCPAADIIVRLVMIVGIVKRKQLQPLSVFISVQVHLAGMQSLSRQAYVTSERCVMRAIEWVPVQFQAHDHNVGIFLRRIASTKFNMRIRSYMSRNDTP